MIGNFVTLRQTSLNQINFNVSLKSRGTTKDCHCGAQAVLANGSSLITVYTVRRILKVLTSLLLIVVGNCSTSLLAGFDDLVIVDLVY